MSDGMVMITPFLGPYGAGFGSKQSEARRHMLQRMCFLSDSMVMITASLGETFAIIIDRLESILAGKCVAPTFIS